MRPAGRYPPRPSAWRSLCSGLRCRNATGRAATGRSWRPRRGFRPVPGGFRVGPEQPVRHAADEYGADGSRTRRPTLPAEPQSGCRQPTDRPPHRRQSNTSGSFPYGRRPTPIRDRRQRSARSIRRRSRRAAHRSPTRPNGWPERPNGWRRSEPVQRPRSVPSPAKIGRKAYPSWQNPRSEPQSHGPVPSRTPPTPSYTQRLPAGSTKTKTSS